MYVGSLKVRMLVREARTLKDKRQVARSILDRLRNQFNVSAAEVDERDAATGFDALDSIVADETSRRIRDAVAKLSPMQRDVFTLRVSEGLSYKEIADVLDSTEGAARVHYHNAVRVVRELLDDDARTGSR